MEQLLGYIKNIGFFLILMSVVCNVLPDNTYKKYCKLFCGLVLVVLVITPFYEFLNYEGDIEDIFISNTYKSQIYELKNQLALQEKNMDEQIVDEFEEVIREEIEGLAMEEGYYLMDVSLSISQDSEGELNIEGMTLYVTTDKNVYNSLVNENKSNDWLNSQENIEEKQNQSEVVHIDDINLDINTDTFQDNQDESTGGDKLNPKAIQLMVKVAEFIGLDEKQIDIKEL